jgi:hypothetical protein
MGLKRKQFDCITYLFNSFEKLVEVHLWVDYINAVRESEKDKHNGTALKALNMSMQMNIKYKCILHISKALTGDITPPKSYTDYAYYKRDKFIASVIAAHYSNAIHKILEFQPVPLEIPESFS